MVIAFTVVWYVFVAAFVSFALDQAEFLERRHVVLVALLWLPILVLLITIGPLLLLACGGNIDRATGIVYSFFADDK